MYFKHEGTKQSHKDSLVKKTREKAGLSFSSSKEKLNSTSGKLKRKIITDVHENGDEDERVKKARKKPKQKSKGLLSFAEDV